uniref:Heterokaryon incompatibility domain-containing protein n=1 Tax=Bionectria ochroleuca TaxID=29856 RepID=A0A8H7TQ80_BIOOC
MRDLERSSPDCALCRLFVQSLADANLKSGEPVILIRDNKSHVVRLPGQDMPVISLYSEPDFASKNLSAPPPGLPLLTKMGSPQQKKLLNAWINLCNKTHNCSLDTANRSAPGRHMPTRLISVGDDYTSTIRLVDSIELSNDKYVALSHRWGDVSNQKMVRTTVSNIDDFKKEIRFESLPRTFQDAVKLARLIGVPFLWIDSLCIIQGDEEDWAKEAARMEEVFSYAYCVFTATSAKSSLRGFLGDREPRPSVAVSTSGNRMYLSKYIDDFEKDVEHGLLNTRGWVLQERALARRTIHITSTQIYWECGHGIYCETLAQLENPRSRLLGDAHFPESSFRYYKYKDEWIRLLQYIQELYSGLTLGYLTDRPKAMQGIEKRIARVFKSQARYGIYEVFFARTMLWTASVTGGLTRIDPMGGKRVPSWSWMSYAGRITYMDIPFRKVLWLENLKNPFDTDQSLELWDEHLSGVANDLVVDAWEGMAEIVFDCGFDQNNRHAWKCVLLGKEGAVNSLKESVYYALIIRPVNAMDSSRG